MERVMHWLTPLSRWIIVRYALMERASSYVSQLHTRLTFLKGAAQAGQAVAEAMQHVLNYILFSMICTLLLAIVSGDYLVFLLLGIGTAVFIPFIVLRVLDRQREKRRQAILMELPEFINAITLQVNAGETIQQALVRQVNRKWSSELEKPEGVRHPLYKELFAMVNDIHNNVALNKALEEWSKRCAMQETSILTTTILLNYRRGGEDFVTALRELGRLLWDRRKAVSRTLGEEASSKLVFPMVLTFVVVMVVVASPAILLMG